MSRKANVGPGFMLKRAEFQTAFDQITQLINSHPNSRLQIELMEKSPVLQPDTGFLKDGLSIAISKYKLLQAFVVAHQVLFTYLQNCPVDKEQNLRDAAAVMLLIDSEHLTAANVRKRLLRNQVNNDWAKAQVILDAELCWVDSYLTSYLHRHTKSPTLWAHRRWVVEQFQNEKNRKTSLAHFKEVILVAAERHPKNYYAWSHMRWLQSLEIGFTASREPEQDPDVVALIYSAQDWCRRNPSDTSGFSFLLHCLTKIESKWHALAVFSNILNFAIDYKWAHESVWVFLRTLASSELEGAESFSDIGNLLSGHPKVRNQLNVAREWCRNYQKKTISNF